MIRLGVLLLLACVTVAAPRPAVALELDRLRMLTSAEQMPWRGVGRINVASIREVSMCTGTLIAEDLVLTAAHCVSDRLTGEALPPGMVHFVAGWRLGQKVGDSEAEAIALHPAYRAGLDSEMDMSRIGADIALVRLATPIPRDKAPFFDVGQPPGSQLPLTLFSYRRDRPHALTRQRGCGVIGIRGAVMALGCDVTFGASGSPVFADADGEARLVGVISAMGRGKGDPVAFAVLVGAAIDEVRKMLP